MIKTVELKTIKPNPFNGRVDYAEQPIKELATEIDKAGFWTGALRGRMNNGKIELCFGHRRVEALKKLGRKEVQIDIVDLSDEEMAMQGLAENLQRQGLNDMEKAEGIKKLVALKSKSGSSKELAYKEIAAMLGVTTGWIETLTGITGYSAPVKKLISERKIAARTAIEAYQLGKDEMVKTAAKEGLPLHTISKMATALKQISDEKVKAKIKAKVISGEITNPKDIQETALPLLQAKAEKGKPPPDLSIIIVQWTDDIEIWRERIQKVIPYKNDISSRIAKEFQEQVRGLIHDLEKLL